MKRTILIHYHEINLKKNNRGRFENRLKEHLECLLRELSHGGISRFAGRMFVALDENSPVEEIVGRLRTAFGISNFACAWKTAADLDEMRNALGQLLSERTFASFKIDARRGTKDFPLNSPQINQELGAFVQSLTRASVRMEDPELTCYVEVVGRYAYIYFDKIRGGGGLPHRTGGRVLCLISGGIDSPVAAFRLIRRGCEALFVHFHSFPHTTRESQEKVRRILQILSRYQMESKLFLVPFADLQREIMAYAPPALRVLLYRRFMVRISEALALAEGAGALVTGDSMGQVASQTLQNLRVVSAAARIQIFRPLIGDDKEDIIHSARAIGTYETSILPDQDCCTLFVPKHPETMARPEQIERAEGLLDIPRLVESALQSTTQEVIAADFKSLEARHV